MNKIKSLHSIILLLLIFGIGVTLSLSLTQRNLTNYAAASSNITVDYSSPSQPISPLAIGMAETGYQTPNVLGNDALQQERIKNLHLGLIRVHLVYSTSVNPASQIVCGGGGCDTGVTGDQWITAIKNTGAVPMVIVNTTSPTDAANMVKHFNKDTNNSIAYWIIGNEPNINGYSSQSYSMYFNQDYDAMKAIDPSIKIGGGTTAWYDQTWLQQFLQASGSRADFVDFHGYPQQGTTAGDIPTLFNWATSTGSDVSKLRSVIQSTVPARANQIFIQVGEWSLNWGGNAQGDSNFNTVWTADVLGNILKNNGNAIYFGTKGNAIKWATGTNTDWYTNITYALQLDDPKAPYHGYGMFTGENLFPHFGSSLVNSTTTLPNVDVFASDNPKNIVVVNKDPSVTQSAVFSLNGVQSGTIDVWRKDNSVIFKDPPVKVTTLHILNGIFNDSIPPLSVTTYVIQSGVLSTGSPSNTPPPTISITPSPTLPPNTTAVLLTLCPHGFGSCGDNVNPNAKGNTNPLHPTRIVTLSLLDALTNVVKTISGTITYNPSSETFIGTVPVGSITSGNYLLKATVNGFLPKQLPGIAQINNGQLYSVPLTSLVTGNVNNDLQLDILDYNVIISCFGAKFNTSSCISPEADINDDGSVDGSDYNLFLRELSVQKGG